VKLEPPVRFPSFEAVLASAAEVICVDIPVGLLDGPGQRPCDTAARRLLGRPRASSVFPPPCRPALTAGDYETACEQNFRVCGRRISRQAYNIARLRRSMP
jgi:predicted RNase H-like nuclease